MQQRTKTAGLKDEDEIELCALLIKAGYTVRRGREKVSAGKYPRYEYFIEFWEGA